MDSLSVVEAFEAMRSFVAQFAAREPESVREPFRLLLLWTERGDDTISDPAQWDDWQASIAEARARLADDRKLEVP
jgi:hypothetical protein